MQLFQLIFSPFATNTYIVECGKGECVVIDCGCYTQKEFDYLVSFLSIHNLTPIVLLNTHCHFDHLFGSARFLNHYGLCYKCHRADIHNAKIAVSESQLFNLSINPPPISNDFIDETDSLLFGNTLFKILHIPGHSPGSLAFYIEEEGVVFCGDTLFRGSIGRTDLYGGNQNQLIESITQQLFTLPLNTKVFPGHGESTTIEHEKNTNPYLIY